MFGGGVQFNVYVLNLRGNAYVHQGERSRAARAVTSSVRDQGHLSAISILVKNPDAAHNGCHIRYRDIGDYLSREQKLAALDEAVSISGFTDWEEIMPNEHHDWIGQRSDVFQQFYPMGSAARKGWVGQDNAIFGLYSRGLSTGKRLIYLQLLTAYTCARKRAS